ncbi:MAG: hypothetical protein HXS54_01220 [Theionarchaea archaeon]|nr:hypothetical protein [Theionarchaea archaeon]
MPSNTEHICLQVTPGGLFFIAYAETRKKEKEIVDQLMEEMRKFGVSFSEIESGWCG